MKGLLVAGAAGAGVAYLVLEGSTMLRKPGTDGKLPFGESAAKYAPYIVGAIALAALHKFMPQAV